MNTLFHLLLCLALIPCNGWVWYCVHHQYAPQLRVSILDIGQGDSILVQGPTGIAMLIDGGPDRSVLRQLGHELPLFDRAIDLVVETHPDKDHIAGLTGVFDQYRISYFMSPGMPDITQPSIALRAAIDRELGLQTFIARRSMRIHLGREAYADVLYPDRDVSKGNTNDASVVLHVVYGATSFLMTGDLPSPVEDYLVSLDTKDKNLRSDVLKAGHHGSKHSTGDPWLAAVRPTYVAISAGRNNSYGHPHAETLARIRNEGARIVSTIESGTLHFISDGRTITYK